MPILFNDQTKEFHLYNQAISYIMTVLPNGQLGQLYYGKKIRHNASFSHLLEQRPRPLSACTFEGNMSFSLEHIRQEYPCYGTGTSNIQLMKFYNKMVVILPSSNTFHTKFIKENQR